MVRVCRALYFIKTYFVKSYQTRELGNIRPTLEVKGEVTDGKGIGYGISLP